MENKSKYEEFIKLQNKLYQMEYDMIDQLIIEEFKAQFTNNETLPSKKKI